MGGAVSMATVIFWMHFGTPEQLDPCLPRCPLFFLLPPVDLVVLCKDERFLLWQAGDGSLKAEMQEE